MRGRERAGGVGFMELFDRETEKGGIGRMITNTFDTKKNLGQRIGNGIERMVRGQARLGDWVMREIQEDSGTNTRTHGHTSQSELMGPTGTANPEV